MWFCDDALQGKPGKLGLRELKNVRPIAVSQLNYAITLYAPIRLQLPFGLPRR